MRSRRSAKPMLPSYRHQALRAKHWEGSGVSQSVCSCQSMVCHVTSYHAVSCYANLWHECRTVHWTFVTCPRCMLMISCCMCVYVYVYVYIYIYATICIRVCVHMNIYIYIHSIRCIVRFAHLRADIHTCVLTHLGSTMLESDAYDSIRCLDSCRWLNHRCTCRNVCETVEISRVVQRVATWAAAHEVARKGLLPSLAHVTSRHQLRTAQRSAAWFQVTPGCPLEGHRSNP